jgi:hypothetical protein
MGCHGVPTLVPVKNHIRHNYFQLCYKVVTIYGVNNCVYFDDYICDDEFGI